MPARSTKHAKKAGETSGPRKRKAPKRLAPTLGHDDIAVRAYFIHLEGGGDPHENWLRAERELLAA